MIEIIIFAIIAFFLFKKLHSILGEEDDKLFFGTDNRQSYVKEIKDAEKVDDNNSEDIETQEKYLNNLSIMEKDYIRELQEKIDGFTIKRFQEISTKVLEMIIKANDEKDKITIKKLLSPHLANIVCASFEEESNNHIVLVECEDNKIERIEKEGAKYRIIINFKMKQINYTTDKNENIIDGNKSEIVNVNEKWTFTHDLDGKNKTWFVDKIEEC